MKTPYNENSWSKAITGSDQIVTTKKELSIFLSESGVSHSEKILLITAVSEICRSFLTKSREFVLTSTKKNEGKKTRLIFEFYISNRNVHESNHNPSLDTFISDADFKKFKSVFNEIDQQPEKSNSAYSLTFTKWINP